MLIKSDTIMVGSTIRYRVQYAQWLENTAYITGATVVASVTGAAGLTVGTIQVQGKDIVFNVTAGANTLNVPVTLTVTMTDSLGNILPDTITLIGVAP